MIAKAMIGGLLLCCSFIGRSAAQELTLQNAAGLRMSVDTEDRDPALQVSVPGGPGAERSFNILMPEHVTVRERGQSEAKHLYIFQPGTAGVAPIWHRRGKSFEYARELDNVTFTARATLQDDGILFYYEFVNHSGKDYEMAWAITDPRFKTLFYDPRLERTYVHLAQGFDLLAAETPERRTMPLSRWFPVRYLAQFTAPIPTERVQKRDDGITYVYKSQRVDVPMIATVSKDRHWIAASFAKNTGNVWSNPELTCQHVDPQVALAAGQSAHYEVKLLLFQGSLQDALHKVNDQRPRLSQSPETF